MLANFYTNSLQGNLLHKLRYLTMGIRHVSSLKREITIADQERVENNGTLDLNKTVKTKMNKTITEDVRESENVNEISIDISSKEINRGYEKTSSCEGIT